MQAGEHDAIAILIDERQRERLRSAGILEGIESDEADARDGGRPSRQGAGDHPGDRLTTGQLSVHVGLDGVHSVPQLGEVPLQVGAAGTSGRKLWCPPLGTHGQGQGGYGHDQGGDREDEGESLHALDRSGPGAAVCFVSMLSSKTVHPASR